MSLQPNMPAPGLGDVEDLSMLDAEAKDKSPLAEFGVTGLRRSAGYIEEEFLPQLRGVKAVQVYREMSANDPIVGAMLFAITELVRGVDWPVIPAGKNREDAKAAKLVETCRDDMSTSWSMFIQEVLTMCTYGWSWHEIVYKRRTSPWATDGRQRSQYTDGMIGWRKLPIRAQDTRQRWIFDDNGGIQGMVQLAPPLYKMTPLPIGRSLLFRTGAHKNNPEGISMLRRAYRPWFYKKRIEEFEAIGVERDLAGMPKVGVPADYLRAKPGTEQAKMVTNFQRLVKGVRRGEQDGVILPLAYDKESNQPLFTFDLVGSPGSRQFDTDKIITRYEQRILMTVLADFIMLGSTQTGTYNMHVDKTGIFKAALNAMVGDIADVINRHAIPRLFAINGWKPQRLPKFQPSNVDAPDLTQLSQFLTSTAGLGFQWAPDAEIERWLRSSAGMPEMSDIAFDEERNAAREATGTRYAQIQTGYLTARSQLAQTIAASQQTAAGQPAMEDQQAAQQAQQQGTSAQQQSESHATQQRQANANYVSSLSQMTTPGGNSGTPAGPSQS